jgi:hypothetical protein
LIGIGGAFGAIWLVASSRMLPAILTQQVYRHLMSKKCPSQKIKPTIMNGYDQKHLIEHVGDCEPQNTKRFTIFS